MQRGDNVMLFSPFVLNTGDPLHIFSDAALHRDCVIKHPLGKKAIDMHEQVLQRLGDVKSRLCSACGQSITDPDDYFTTGYLVSDPVHPLFAFNFVQLHKSHLSGWPRTVELRRLLAEERRTGNWQGPDVL
jgi:hypothetical protein